jgi:hypothetical protein
MAVSEIVTEIVVSARFVRSVKVRDVPLPGAVASRTRNAVMRTSFVMICVTFVSVVFAAAAPTGEIYVRVVPNAVPVVRPVHW